MARTVSSYASPTSPATDMGIAMATFVGAMTVGPDLAAMNALRASMGRLATRSAPHRTLAMGKAFVLNPMAIVSVMLDGLVNHVSGFQPECSDLI